MDIEKLIERLRTESLYADKASLEIMDLCMDAATALSALQAENERLRKELEYEREHANAYHEECGQWEAENEKLRAELEQKEKYYEQMIDALSATDSADLAQTTACVYYKPGGLCRYGGDDPANVCVLGPCPHERTAEEVLADLARVTAERDAAQALPCKVGDTVYQVDDIRVYALEVRNLIYDAGILAFDESTIGKTVFLTRAEAEAARREQA